MSFAAKGRYGDTRVGVIGAGRIAERHIAAYKHLGVGHVMLTDADFRIANERAAAWQVGVVPDARELIESSDVQAIDVCAPTKFHAEYVTAALSAGKDVFCEKPLCTSSEEAASIRAAATKSGRVAMTGYLYRFYPAFEFVKGILEEGIIGDPYMALIRVGGRGGTSAWKHQSGQGGGAVSEMMVHMLDLAAWFFGPLSNLQPLWQETILSERDVARQKVSVTAEDFSVVRMDAGQVKILCQSDLVTPSYMQHIDIQGDNGSIFTSILHYLPTVVFCKQPRGIYDQGNNLYTFPQVNVFELELAHFLDAINGSPHTRNGLEDSIHIVELMEQIVTI